MSANDDSIILYDLPSVPPRRTWSLNPWKTRLFLNYKKIPYRTEWVEYPDVAPKLSKLVPGREGVAFATDVFTIPTITLPTNPPTHIMDSWAIAQHLEKQHPSPSLQLSHPTLDLVNKHTVAARNELTTIFMPLVCTTILPPRSAEYFRRTREERLKRTLEEHFNDPEKGGDKAFAAAGKAGLKPLADLYAETKQQGPFVLGKEVSYADFVAVSFLKMFDRIGQLDGLISHAGENGGELRRLFEACGPWFERDDR